MECKVALVTGAGIGIGKGIAIELAKAGYAVAVHCNSHLERAQMVCKQIVALGGYAVPIQADLSSETGVAALFSAFRTHFDRLDVFVNNAGITMGAKILDMQVEDFDTVCLVNWRAAHLCIQQAARTMVDAQCAGSIVVISSNHHKVCWSGASVYGSMKAALEKYVRHAAVEFARYGIRVNSIAPGYVDTGEARMGEKEPTYRTIPMHRWVSLEEMGQIALFLCGPWARSITGASLTVDGGATLLFGAPESYGL